jgi:hypothetical protein
MFTAKLKAQIAVWMLGIGLMWLPLEGMAQNYRVTLDTSHLGGSYSLVFDFVDGDLTPGSRVTVDGFSFGGGGISGSPIYNCTSNSTPGSSTVCPDVSGDLSSSIRFTDNTDFFSEAIVGFTAGSELAFNVGFTTNFAGGTPDSFFMYILDGIVIDPGNPPNPIATTDGSGANTFFAVDIDAAGNYANFSSSNPVITSTANMIPEPSDLALVIVGLGVLGLIAKPRKA